MTEQSYYIFFAFFAGGGGFLYFDSVTSWFSSVFLVLFWCYLYHFMSWTLRFNFWSKLSYYFPSTCFLVHLTFHFGYYFINAFHAKRCNYCIIVLSKRVLHYLLSFWDYLLSDNWVSTSSRVLVVLYSLFLWII